MSATSPFVGVRVFSDLRSNVVSIDTRDSTAIGMVLPAPAADTALFPLDQVVLIDTEDTELVAELGAGLALDAVNQIVSEGITANILFVRVQHSVLTDVDAKLAAEMGAIVGSAAAKTGVYALLDAKAQVGIEPGFIIAPGYTNTRPGNLKNPVAAAIDTVAAQIVDCMGVVDCTLTNQAAAITYASDFATSLNMIAAYPAVQVMLGGQIVTRPMSPHIAAAHVRRDKETGTPFKAAWNRPLKGILGLSTPISYRDGDPACQANLLVQAGIATVIENTTLWAPFTTATDATVKAYRSIKRIRTRRSIEKAIQPAMRAYLSEDLGPHLVLLITEALSQACSERKALGALVDYEVVWKRGINTNTTLRDGILRLKLRFEETPDLVDLQIFSEPQPEAFDVLAGEIAAALQRMGNPNVTVAA
jgi:phage tail sheath protein FI